VFSFVAFSFDKSLVTDDALANACDGFYLDQRWHRKSLDGLRFDAAESHTPPRCLPAIRLHYKLRLLPYRRSLYRCDDLNIVQSGLLCVSRCVTIYFNNIYGVYVCRSEKRRSFIVFDE
jgi:hypothetical protein